MATIKNWQEDLENKSVAEVKTLQSALYTLKGWDLFDKEYSELSLIQLMMKGEIEAKERKGSFKN